jgi:hypothetical protein
VHVHVAPRMLRQDRHCPAFVLRVEGANPKHHPTALELLLDLTRMMLAEELGENGADQSAACSSQSRSRNNARQGAARCDNSSHRGDRAHIDKTPDERSLSFGDHLRLNIVGAGNSFVIFDLAHFRVFVTKLLVDRLFGGKQTDFRLVESRTQQIIDGAFESIHLIEDADHLAYFAAVIIGRHGFPR